MRIEQLKSPDAHAEGSVLVPATAPATASEASPANACADTCADTYARMRAEAAASPATHATLPMRWHPGWLLALASFFVLMVVLGGIPGEAQALSDRYGDKLLHTLAYGFMALLCERALQAPPVLRALVTVGVVALLGLLDESLQSLLPYRNASALDWCFDIGAAAIVAALLACHAQLFQVDEPDA